MLDPPSGSLRSLKSEIFAFSEPLVIAYVYRYRYRYRRIDMDVHIDMDIEIDSGVGKDMG